MLRDEFDLSLGQIGVVLSAAWLGSTLTLLPWGLAADRFGERVVLALGLFGAAGFLAAAGYAQTFAALYVLLALAGAAGASVNSASGRAVMLWFAPSERGLALGIRQTAIPLGGLIVALVVPHLAASGGSRGAFLFLAALAALGGIVGLLVIRGRDGTDDLEAESVVATLRDGRLWRLSVSSGLYLYAQVAIIGFGVLFLHDEHGLSDSNAALVVAASQVLAVGLRIGAGRWSDVVGSRVGPLHVFGLAVAVRRRHGGVRRRAGVGARPGAGRRRWALDGLERSLVHGRRRARGRRAQRCGDRVPADDPVGARCPRADPVRAERLLVVVGGGVRIAALFPLAGWRGLRPLRAY